MNETLLSVVALVITMIACTASAVAYLERRIDRKLSAVDYELKHNALEQRVWKLEIWAARQNGPTT